MSYFTTQKECTSPIIIIYLAGGLTRKTELLRIFKDYGSKKLARIIENFRKGAKARVVLVVNDNYVPQFMSVLQLLDKNSQFAKVDKLQIVGFTKYQNDICERLN